MYIISPIYGCIMCQHVLGGCTINFERNSFRSCLAVALLQEVDTSGLSAVLFATNVEQVWPVFPTLFACCTAASRGSVRTVTILRRR